jgi:hypothetical protein
MTLSAWMPKPSFHPLDGDKGEDRSKRREGETVIESEHPDDTHWSVEGKFPVADTEKFTSQLLSDWKLRDNEVLRSLTGENWTDKAKHPAKICIRRMKAEEQKVRECSLLFTHTPCRSRKMQFSFTLRHFFSPHGRIFYSFSSRISYVIFYVHSVVCLQLFPSSSSSSLRLFTRLVNHMNSTLKILNFPSWKHTKFELMYAYRWHMEVGADRDRVCLFVSRKTRENPILGEFAYKFLIVKTLSWLQQRSGVDMVRRGGKPYKALNYCQMKTVVSNWKFWWKKFCTLSEIVNERLCSSFRFSVVPTSPRRITSSQRQLLATWLFKLITIQLIFHPITKRENPSIHARWLSYANRSFLSLFDYSNNTISIIFKHEQYKMCYNFD